MSSRSIYDLRPEVRPMVVLWEGDMAQAGIDYIITCTLRSVEEQAALYASGRSVPGPIRTNAKPGQSAHQYGLAFNFVVMVNGKPDWSGDDPLWNKAIALAESRGLHSLRPMESAHLEHPNWKQLATETAV